MPRYAQLGETYLACAGHCEPRYVGRGNPYAKRRITDPQYQRIKRMSVSNKIIDVAVAVIMREQQVLITYRSKQQDCGECWEFPGGKFEPGETLQQALQRECHEELGIQIESSKAWLSVQHVYPEYIVRLHVCLVDSFSGEPRGQENQAVRWSSLQGLNDYHFPAANDIIVEGLMEV